MTIYKGAEMVGLSMKAVETPLAYVCQSPRVLWYIILEAVQ